MTAEAAEPRAQTRARLFKVARWVAAAVLLGVLASRLDLNSLSGLFLSLSALTVVQLVLLGVAQQLFLAQRQHTAFRFMVDARGAGPRPLSRLSVMSDWLVAAAYSAVLPSSIGGDVVRYLRSARYLPAPDAQARALALLFVDRLVGLAALCTGPLLFTAYWGRTALGGTPGVLLVTSLVLLALWQTPRLVNLLARLLPARLPRARGFLQQVEEGLRAVPPSVRAKMFSWSLGYQLCVGLFFEAAVAGWGLGPEVHQAIWVGLPTALALTVLPVSIGGLGLRESLFAAVFGAFGLGAEQGVALGLLWGALWLGWALVGAVLQGVRRDER